MAGAYRTFDTRFAPHWPSYVWQSAITTGAVLVILIALRHQNLVVAASLAATAFTVFTMPGSVTASSRNVIGGHLVGLAFGSIFTLFQLEAGLTKDIVYALAVGCSMFVMTITDTEHPPAAGTALGVVIAGFSARVVLGVLVGVAILAVAHRLLGPFLRDLIEPPESTVDLEEGQ